MFTLSPNKVKFQDEQLEDYLLEISALKSKLQSKIDGLTIMSRELDKCNMERDRYKLLVEQLSSQKNTLPFHQKYSDNEFQKYIPRNIIAETNMLGKTKDINNMLKLEVETLRSKLEEATGDIGALRKQLQKYNLLEDSYEKISESTLLSYSNEEYEQLVQELEKCQDKYQKLQLDYRALLDEKEELFCDRDYYKSKVQRLNHQISYFLANRMNVQQDETEGESFKPVVDIDALVMENKYLNERITQLQIEKEIVKRTMLKYKDLLENRNKSGTWDIRKGFPDVMTQKQVREFLDFNSKGGLKRTSVMELKSLCIGLFEALNDKSVALQHQRKTNVILANRITELEKTLESWCNGKKCIPIFPAQMLLDEFDADADSPRSESRIKLTNQQESSDDDDDRKGHNLVDCVEGNIFEPCCDSKLNSKTVLPIELEELVREALAELKPSG